MERVQAQRGVLAGGQGAVTDPFGRIRADQADLAGPLGPEEIEELLQGGPVVTGLGPHQPAGVVIDDDHQVAVAAPVGDLVDPDPGEPIEGISHRPGIGDDTPGDRAHGPPGDPHQLDHCRLRGVGDEPGDLVIESTGVAGAVTGPWHRRDDHPVVPARHPGRVGFDEHLHRPRIECPPTSPALTVVVAAPTAPAVPAPTGRVRSGPTRHHDLIRRLIDIDALDHHPAVDPNDPRPYPLRLHAAATPLSSSLRTAGKPSRAAACTAPLV